MTNYNPDEIIHLTSYRTTRFLFSTAWEAGAKPLLGGLVGGTVEPLLCLLIRASKMHYLDALDSVNLYIVHYCT